MPKTPRVTPMPFPLKRQTEDKPTPEVHEHAAHGKVEAHRKVEEIDSGLSGQRKLIRPVLPEEMASRRKMQRGGFRAMLTRSERIQPAAAPQNPSNAEAFYFQKQIQDQTQMVLVLDDGTQVAGYIEWYDRNCIKLRNSGRVLIYKSAIKYLYKASEQNEEFRVMPK